MTKSLILAAALVAAMPVAAAALDGSTTAPGLRGSADAAPAPAKKKPLAKPKPAGAASAPQETTYPRQLQEPPRRIRREDLEDDPSAPSRSSVRPVITPEGRAGLGGRF
jgi:hypothetical protein